jgi:hypothetical protein
MKSWLLALCVVSSICYSGEFVVHGSGGLSCGRWTEDRKADDDWYKHGQWIQGYTVARADMGARLQRTDQERINLWMDTYCQQYPLNDLLDGARAMVLELELPPLNPE